MRLVANHQVPPAVRRLQLGLHILVSRQLVQPGDHQVRLQEPIPGSSRLKLVIGQNFKRQREATIKLILPLLCEASWANDKTALEITSGDELLDK